MPTRDPANEPWGNKEEENYLAIRENELRRELSTEEAFKVGLKRQDVDACRRREGIWTEENVIQINKGHKVGKQSECMKTQFPLTQLEGTLLAQTGNKLETVSWEKISEVPDMWPRKLAFIQNLFCWLLGVVKTDGQWSRIRSWCDENSLLLSSWHTGVSGQDFIRGAT